MTTTTTTTCSTQVGSASCASWRKQLEGRAGRGRKAKAGTHALVAVAVKNACIMCQFSTLSCETTTLGSWKPAAAMAAPNAAPDNTEAAME